MTSGCGIFERWGRLRWYGVYKSLSAKMTDMVAMRKRTSVFGTELTRMFDVLGTYS
jgi:hypothetical protein